VIGKPIWNISSAQGYIYNTEGQWLSTPNRILGTESSAANKLLWNYGRSNVGIDNFRSIELREIKVEEFHYFLLIKKMTDGYYKYKTLAEGWVGFTSLYYMVIDTPRIVMKDSNLTEIRADIIYAGAVYIPTANFLQEIGLDINKKRLGAEKDISSLYEGNTFRFIIEKHGSKCHFYLGEFETSDKLGLRFIPSYSEYMFEEKPMESFYYETSYSTISPFLKFTND